MKRKINFFGGYSLGMVLPKEWADKNRLTKGSSVDVIVTDEALIVKPVKENETA